MANAKFNKVSIDGVVTVVPPLVKSIDDEIELYGGNKKQIKRIKSAIGLDKRRVTDESTTTSDLCFQAAQLLFSGLSLDKREIDGLVFVTQTPDHFQPSNAAILHGRLGLEKNCASFDVNLGCSGYVYGLWLAHMMIVSGSCSKVLLLAGDTLSKCVNSRDRSTAPLFGDAGSATLVTSSENVVKSFFSLHTDGSGSSYIQIPAGAFRHRPSATTSLEIQDDDGNWRSRENLYMSGGDVFGFSIQTEPVAITEVLSYSDLTINEVDYFIFHQANKYIITNISKRLKLPAAKVPCDTVSKYGNQSSASIPATINDAIFSQASTERKKLVLSGFGVGLSWASAVIELDKIYCPEIRIYNNGN